ncbi:WD40 repeat domain-containing protein [bacterium]|nr:WD40 repeat domain-containing protein [bacterium]
MQDRFQAIQELAFSPNDRLIATVGYSDDPVVIFDISSGKRLGAFAADKTNTNSIVFTHDGRYIITGGSDGDISIWDTLALTEGPTVEDLWGKVPADVQPDGWSRDATRSTRYRLERLKRLAGEADFDLADVEKARGLVRTMEVAGDIETVRLSPNGTLVAALNKNNIYVFEFSTGEKIKEHHVGQYTSGQDIRFSGDGKWLALKTTNRGTLFHLDTFLKSKVDQE